MKTIKTVLVLLACIYLLSGCNNSSKPAADTPDFKKLISDWNKAHNSKDVAIFSDLFDSSVLFYGTQTDKNACIESKLSLLKKNPDFFQQIFGEIEVENLNDRSVRCSFVKRVTVNQETKDYPSYLTFKQVGNDWKISTEGDLITDKNLEKKREISIPVGAIEGDFDGDGTIEYVWLAPPKFPKEQNEDNFGECDGPCECYLMFSNDNIPSIKLENCIGGTPVNEGDLNNDGADEIGILPDWWTSCWREYQVYTFRNNKWKYVVAPFSTHCNQWEEGVDAIIKDHSRPGYVIINYSHLTEDDIVTISKSVLAEK